MSANGNGDRPFQVFFDALSKSGRPVGDGLPLGEILNGMADLLDADSGITCPSASKSPRRRGRPLGGTALAIREGVDQLTGEYERMTVRQVFYALEVRGVIEKTEGGYRQVQAQVLKMRREGVLPWEFITDGTRWQRKPDSFDDVEDFMGHMARTYRRDLWQSQGKRIEIWLEKDALADIVVDVTSKWDVPLMVSRGQSSATFLHSAAKAAEAAYEKRGTETFIYALYDFDAGGERAWRTVYEQIPEYAPRTPIWAKRLAVTEQQITEWGLPTRPPKAKDPQAKAWGDRPAAELDAIPPDKLVQIVEDAITQHVDEHAWYVQQQVENQERQGLLALTNGEAS